MFTLFDADNRTTTFGTFEGPIPETGALLYVLADDGGDVRRFRVDDLVWVCRVGTRLNLARVEVYVRAVDG